MTSFNHRIFNFSAGPAVLPESVLEKASSEMMNFRGTGMSLMEMSHRSPCFEDLLQETKDQVRRLLSLSDDFEILFLQGGARHQFAMLPLNFLKNDKAAYFVNTGYWTQLAAAESSRIGRTDFLASSESQNFAELPTVDYSKITHAPAFVHFCSNNTIAGTQWRNFPTSSDFPMTLDMSSDIASREIPFNSFDLIYAAAQKNLGPAGITLVLIKKSFLESGREDLPEVFQYRAHASAQSMFNTPPTFIIYMMHLVLNWMEEEGGLKKIESKNQEKAKAIYDCIDQSDFYTSPILRKEERSLMNVVFRIQNGNKDLEAAFLNQSEENGFSGLKGHRIRGGLRASIYNAQSLQAVQALCQFMKDFEKNHG